MQHVSVDEPLHESTALVLGQVSCVPARATGRTAASAAAVLVKEGIAKKII